jgi:hypothetical protein
VLGEQRLLWRRHQATFRSCDRRVVHALEHGG